VFFVLLVLCLFSSLSIAATVSYITTTPITPTDWSCLLSFPKFDPSLGTLNLVQIDLFGNMNTVFTVTNASQSKSSGNAKTEIQFIVQDTGSNLTVPEIDIFSPAFSYNLAAGQSATSGTLTKSGSSSDLYTSVAVLSAFTGTDMVTLNADTFTQTLLANTGGNTAVNQVTDAQLTGTVTYNYTIPEPTTISLLGLGGLLLCRRK